MPMRFIHDLWARRKLSHHATKMEALLSRQMGARRLMEMVDFVAEEEARLEQNAQVKVVEARLTKTLRPFRSSPGIEEFMQQFLVINAEPKSRYRMLLLRGSSCSGKTQKARSLFGSTASLLLNCQGMSPDLPSIEGFNRSQHQAIVWDEIDHKQVLGNKVAFQSGVDPVTLGQSKCNQHAYRRWLHGTPMILCSNVFQWPEDEGHTLSKADADWILANVIMVPVPKGKAWYVGEWSSDEEQDDFI